MTYRDGRSWALTATALALLVPVWFVDSVWLRAILGIAIAVAYLVATKHFAGRFAEPS